MSGENAVTKSKVTRPEAQLRRQADELDERAQKAQEDFRPAQYAEYDEGVEGRTLPPRKLSYPNRGADRMQKKGAAVDMLANQAGVGGSGAPIMMTIDERDIEAADHARKNANIARYKNWLDTAFDLRSPAEAAWVEKIMPDMYEERLRELEQHADLDLRIAKLRMFGIRSPEDAQLAYFVTNGIIKPPRGALWDWENWQTSLEKTNGFASGLFSFRKAIAASKRGAFNQRFDVLGNGMNQGIRDPLYAYPGEGRLAANANSTNWRGQTGGAAANYARSGPATGASPGSGFI